MTEHRTTAMGSSEQSSGFFFCVKLMRFESGKMFAGSRIMMPSLAVVSLFEHKGVGGYSLLCAFVNTSLCAPLPYGISPPKNDDLKRR
jgi:hypothetical protein